MQQAAKKSRQNKLKELNKLEGIKDLKKKKLNDIRDYSLKLSELLQNGSARINKKKRELEKKTAKTSEDMGKENAEEAKVKDLDTPPQEAVRSALRLVKQDLRRDFRGLPQKMYDSMWLQNVKALALSEWTVGE